MEGGGGSEGVEGGGGGGVGVTGEVVGGCEGGEGSEGVKGEAVESEGVEGGGGGSEGVEAVEGAGVDGKSLVTVLEELKKKTEVREHVNRQFSCHDYAPSPLPCPVPSVSQPAVVRVGHCLGSRAPSDR